MNFVSHLLSLSSSFERKSLPCPISLIFGTVIQLCRSNIHANVVVEIFKTVSRVAKVFPREFLHSLVDQWELTLSKYCVLVYNLVLVFP